MLKYGSYNYKKSRRRKPWFKKIPDELSKLKPGKQMEETITGLAAY